MGRAWRYVNKDGNPDKTGVYWVTLIYPEWKNKEKTGRTVATVASRYFGEAENNKGWIMEDQPDTGLVWTEECGSVQGESVWAWMPIEDVEIADLPDGVEVEHDG